MAITRNIDAPLVAVVGATGVQGGSVIKALSESDKAYRIRGFTRDTSQARAQELSKQGVEVVAIDLSITNKKEVNEAFNGATFAFAVTSSAPTFDKEKEIAEGKLLVDAAHAAGVTLLVWSGLESITEASKGKFTTVIHFDAKAEVTKYARAIGIPFVNVEPAVYMSNYTQAGPKKLPDGSYILPGVQAPDGVQHLLDTQNDYGLFVRKAIEQPGLVGSEIYAYGEAISMKDIAKQLSEATGKDIKYVQITEEQFKAAAPFPTPAVKQEFLDMFLYFDEFGYYGGKDISTSQQGLARQPNTWADFVKATDWSKVL